MRGVGAPRANAISPFSRLTARRVEPPRVPPRSDPRDKAPTKGGERTSMRSAALAEVINLSMMEPRYVRFYVQISSLARVDI